MELVKLPHGFVGTFNGEYWKVWESKEDYDRGFYPYEGFLAKFGAHKMLTEEDAIKFAKKQYKAQKMKDKWAEKY